MGFSLFLDAAVQSKHTKKKKLRNLFSVHLNINADAKNISTKTFTYLHMRTLSYSIFDTFQTIKYTNMRKEKMTTNKMYNTK
ncbi:hypothetical protein L1887_12220 [Cichorium endivia]|nr:hypothetical protein L1887_12220 [Cichorium endivia]